jgi:hypothetical protein
MSPRLLDDGTRLYDVAGGVHAQAAEPGPR